MLVPVTVAVSLMVVPAAAVTFTVIAMVAPLSDESDSGARLPTLQLTVLPPVHVTAVVVQTSFLLTMEQLMTLPEALWNVVPLGSVSLTTTFQPPPGPSHLRRSRK